MEAIRGTFCMKQVIIAIIIATIAKFLADEFREWITWLPKKLISLASLRFQANELQKRYEEEWLAHLNDCPGSLGKLGHALGCLSAAIHENSSILSISRLVLFRFARMFTTFVWGLSYMVAALMLLPAFLFEGAAMLLRSILPSRKLTILNLYGRRTEYMSLDCSHGIFFLIFLLGAVSVLVEKINEIVALPVPEQEIS